MRDATRFAVVAAGWRDEWSDEQAYVRHLAGALAEIDDVDVLLAEGQSAGESREGAVRVVSFPGSDTAPGVPDALLEGVSASDLEPDRAPALVVEQAARADGGDSAALLDHLRTARYETVVFAGFRYASTLLGARVVPDGVRIVLVPLLEPRDRRLPPAHLATFARASVLVTRSEAERSALARLSGVEDDRAQVLRPLVRVNPIARTTPATEDSASPVLLFRADALDARNSRSIRRLCELLERRHPDARLVAIGRRCGYVSWERGTELVFLEASSRTDFWRWMHRATALVDVEARSFGGRDVLEAMAIGAPVLVRPHGGASFDYVEASGGGLPYRGMFGLLAAVEVLRDPAAREALGARGRAFVEQMVAGSEAWSAEAARMLLGQSSRMTPVKPS